MFLAFFALNEFLPLFVDGAAEGATVGIGFGEEGYGELACVLALEFLGLGEVREHECPDGGCAFAVGCLCHDVFFLSG